MYYYFYRTTNLINGKYYQGVHHSSDPETDSYYGSGCSIQAAVRKYGRENFKVEILKYFDSLDEAYEYEASVITLDSLDANICYNQVPGGKGCKEGVICMCKDDQEIRVHKKLQSYYESLGYVKGRSGKAKQNVSNTHKGKPSKQRGRIYLHLGTDVEVRVKPEDIDKYLNKGYQKGHSQLSKDRVRVGHLGKVWINNGVVERCVSAGEVDLFLEQGFKRGKLPFTEDHKKKLSLCRLGKKDTEETRAKRRLAKVGRTWTVINGKRVWSKR